MGGFTAGLAEAIRVTFRREVLPPAAPPPEPPAGRSAGSLLFSPEPLPPDLPPLPRRGGRWLAWLLSPESLDP